MPNWPTPSAQASHNKQAGWQQEPIFSSLLHLKLLHPAITSNNNSSCSQTRGHCWHKAKRKQSLFSQYRVCSNVCQSPHRKCAGSISRAENTSMFCFPPSPAGTYRHTRSWKERGRFKEHWQLPFFLTALCDSLMPWNICGYYFGIPEFSEEPTTWKNH